MEKTKGCRQKERETKDRKREENIFNNDLKTNRPSSATRRNLARDYSDQKEGIVRITRNSQEDSDGEFHTMQEQHNANHALYYFSIISDAAVSGRQTGNDCEKIRRIIEHMMSLREFISEDKVGLMEVVNALLEDLRKFCPVQRRQFAAFIYENWARIQIFAEAYGHHDRCFPKDKYQKLQDVVLGRCYFKPWWWKLKAKKLHLRFKKLIKEAVK